ncbi:MAG: M67 family metallopeptidase [Burkholderiales bacterium]|jgi:proteasome lid subunit RPN8/RPN11|nr:M67 family metallopeptidase [Burkholderiales bacterium]
MIKLYTILVEAIRQEGEKTYPNECCGFILGQIKEDGVKEAETLIPIKNAREAEEQYHRFEIGPEDFIKADNQARKENQEIIGFYHSHPDHPAYPSEYDREHALPFYSYIIVSVDKGTASAITSWELEASDRSRFIEEKIVWQ